MSKLRVACTAISRTIQAGRVNKAGDSFIGDPVDVTGDCLRAVIDKIGPGNEVTVNVDGTPTYIIAIKKL